MAPSQTEFAEQYAPMSEGELEELVLAFNDLVPPAQAALLAELAQRKLPFAPPANAGASQRASDPEPDESLVTVARYRDLSEAVVARAVLERAGLRCWLYDENTVRMDWMWSNFIGGMRLRVGSRDEAEALALLAQPMPSTIELDNGETFEQPHCPRCGSMDVKSNDTPTKASVLSLFLLPFPLPSMKRTNTWRCNDCGCVWLDDGQPDPAAA
jgi:hypothetical protein